MNINTPGTSGTRGITSKNISVPLSAVRMEPTTSTVGSDGTAVFTITAGDPGNVRKSLDGQVYFIQYTAPGVAGFRPDPNDLISLQIYEHLSIANPTWANGVAEILPQFGQLYPVMGKFGLREHEAVKQNAGMIRRVLELDFAQPLHMPATRDLSASRRKIILDWMDAGMP